MPVPKYVARIARLPEVFARLADHPDGMPLGVLAAEVGLSGPGGEAELREDLLAFFTADPGWTFNLSRPSVLEFLGPEGDDADPASAQIVRITEPADLGVEHLDADELGLIYTAATSLLDVEPGDADLADAVAVIEETMFGPAAGEVSERREPADWNRWTEQLHEAVARRRRVRIVYSPAWTQGVRERVVEPWRLTQTRRGWELDGAVAGSGGGVRTYLLSHIRSLDVLEETFEPPADLEDLLAAQRATTTVRMELPHDARWAADMYAESVDAIEDGDDSFVADLALLPPVGRRVGLLMLAAGGDVRVLSPAALVSAGPELAAELLRHHGG